jgi:hypothetical protein
MNDEPITLKHKLMIIGIPTLFTIGIIGENLIANWLG